MNILPPLIHHIRLLLLATATLLILTAGVPTLRAGDDPPAPAINDAELTSGTVSETRSHRVLLIVSPECEQCAEQLRALEATGGTFDLLRRRGWRIGQGPHNHIQIVDVAHPVEDDIASIVSAARPGRSPAVIYIEDGSIARSFHRGCTTPLDPWTFGWLMTGNDDRPVEYDPEPVDVPTTGHYRLRGNHWSVEGNWNPTREEVVHHLRSVHGSQLQSNWAVETWSLEELRSLHDDLHDREEGFRGRYAGNTASRSGSSQGVFRKPGNSAR